MMGNEEEEGTFKEEPREDTRSGEQHHVHELDLFFYHLFCLILLMLSSSDSIPPNVPDASQLGSIFSCC